MKKNEAGRSMVEMLGVLAIAAIITLGGLSGYRVAMNKLRANGITELIAMTSVYAQTHNIHVTRFEDLDDDYEDSVPECVEGVYADTDGKVTLTFKDSDSCKEIMNLVGTSFGKCRWEEEGLVGTFNPKKSALINDTTGEVTCE